ncbi:TetR/AcrR family transcriptional regulator [Candidatus Methylobacter oryzae]|uniref:TetR/AcrR family transcriptional regulator n=1 Tax=Candidatus Methylobacter oryzae TaxID=2497749 RepID=A0ABY3CAC8_9GAMM|nr:TetR/AcrR family transcriptional regulator [Candidatus Methylobacter oryzae]TRW95022.1 TetR/AcrR family transcriptional regulator [Candidatus Methylobacter oryzae]
MARRNKHSLDEIKEMVLAAAETIIVNEGSSALTARRIAMDIGYTVGSIYMVFDSMADLITHINAATVDNLSGQMQQVPDCAPEQHITELAKTYVAFAGRNFNRWSMIFIRDNEPPEWYRQKIKQIFSLVDAQFARLAPNGPAQQNRLAANALWSGIHGICSLSLSRDQDATAIKEVEDAVVLLAKNFIDGWVGSLHREN